MLRRLPGSGRVAACVLSAAICVTAFFAAAPSALAHESLISSTPKQNEVFDSSSWEVELSFSNEPIETGAEIRVIDGAETDWVTEDARLDGSTVVVGLDPQMPDGDYTVQWRVVSGDGHPISGTIPFSVGGETVAAEDASTRLSAEGGEPTGVESVDAGAEGGAGLSEPREVSIPLVVTIGLLGLLVSAATAVAIARFDWQRFSAHSD